MDDAELERLLADLESDRTERKESATDGEKIRQAVCAFANDLPDHRQPGIIFIGADDRGACVNLSITDRLLRTLADMRSDGNIVPIPTMLVQKRTIRGCELAVIIVQPSDAPPVRFKGTTWIRVGPRRAIASADEERRLAEKRRARDLLLDLHPVHSATLDDLDTNVFQREYLPATLAPAVLAQNDRSLEHQLLATRFTTTDAPPCPTVLGLLVVGKSPSDFIPGAYIQFLRLDGTELTDPIKSQTSIHGPLAELLTRTDGLLKANISAATDIASKSVEVRTPDYPIVSLQQMVRNAVMHRSYETSNAPVRITWFSDRVEVHNPGGPFGQVTRANFGAPGITDYRNPHLAEALRNLGYVQRFGVGIAYARREMEKNDNPPPEFIVEDAYVSVILRRRR
ncbi:MAG TPA: ATP-binding protein [Phycisphaerae bacterium]|nr:ATP-binding protein [Phycisphaerae bacterium]HNU45785.1 ATP-binding protein [Phycisphaerae bacterium]